MANTVNVTTANTFEQWRVKTNELGTGIGDLDKVTNSDIGATSIIGLDVSSNSAVGKPLVSSSIRETANIEMAIATNATTPIKIEG